MKFYGNELTAAEARILMRAHKRTIRGLARQLDVTMVRVRQVREIGVQGVEDTRSWYEAIVARRVCYYGSDDRQYYGWAYPGSNNMTVVRYHVPTLGLRVEPVTAYLDAAQAAERLSDSVDRSAL